MPLPSRYEARIVELLDDGRGYTITELATMLGTTRQNVHKTGETARTEDRRKFYWW